MSAVDWYVLKDFLDLTPPDVRSILLKNLSTDDQEDLAKIHKLPFQPYLGFTSAEEDVHALHYSWFIPFFQHLSDNDRYLFLFVLSEDQQMGIKQYFDLTKEPKTLSLLSYDFMIETLHHAIYKSDELPIACLPEDPLNPLLKFSRSQILKLVDLLSMHDLAAELPTLIHAANLDKIKNVLNSDQKKFLSSLAKEKEPITFKSMGLSLWDGNEDSLKAILHQRGLNRLSKALVFSNPSFIWHLQHKLDTGRASVVKTLIRQLKNKKAHQILIAQVCRLIEILTPS